MEYVCYKKCMKQIKKKWFELLSWLLLLITAIVLYFRVSGNVMFPSAFKLPLIVLLALIISLTGIFSIISKRFGRYFMGLVNLFLIVCMIIVMAFLPKVKEEAGTIFKETGNEEAIINFYALKDGIDDIKDEDIKFIVQKALDQENQENALEKVKKYLNKEGLNIVEKEDILSAVEALYGNEGDVLVLNEVYVDAIEEVSSYRDFSDVTKVLYSVSRTLEEETKTYEHKDITSTPFTVYLAGCDTRSGRLTTYGRTDVNLVLSINPNTKQILIVGLPRDSYIPNPSIDYGDDKLTHLGNHGIENTMKGVSEYFDISIDHYGEAIFETFKGIIDALGGIDVDNPYYFNTIGGNGAQFSMQDYEFPEGTIHLTGDSALAYCRERWNLKNGDYDRNEHQTFVIKAVLNKILSKEILDKYVVVWDSLKGQFMTDIPVDDMFELAAMQIDDNSDWDIITYHLGGTGDMCGTASMGWNRKLYVVHLFDSQVSFVHDQIDKLMNDEAIKQEVLPQNDETTYIPN